MKPSNRKSRALDIVCWVLGALPLAASLAARPFLPARIPMHFDFAGNIDGWGTWGELLALSFIGLGVAALLHFLPRWDPKGRNYARFARSYGMLRLTCGVFFCAVLCLMIAVGLWPDRFAAAAGGATDIGRWIGAGVGVMICVVGNFLPKVKQNYFCGIKTPWALASEDNWRRTHRFAGPVWFWCGLAVAAAGLLAPAALQMPLMLALALTCLAVPYGYSYWIYKNRPKGGENDAED